MTEYRLGGIDAARLDRRWNSLQSRVTTLTIGGTARLLLHPFFIENFGPIARGMAEMAAAVAAAGGDITLALDDMERLSRELEPVARRRCSSCC